MTTDVNLTCLLAADFTSTSIEGVSIEVSQGSGSNPAKYYESGDSVRFYVGNTFTITSESTISQIAFSQSDASKGYGNLSASTGSYDPATGVWTGSATTVTFTVDAAQARLNKVTVTLA